MKASTTVLVGLAGLATAFLVLSAFAQPAAGPQMRNGTPPGGMLPMGTGTDQASLQRDYHVLMNAFQVAPTTVTPEHFEQLAGRYETAGLPGVAAQLRDTATRFRAQRAGGAA